MKYVVLCIALCICAPVLAQDDPSRVTLKALHGTLTLSGRIISYDGQYLQIDTEYGALTVDYSTVTCDGATCPDPDHYVPVVRLSGSPRMLEVLMPALVESFARDRGQSVMTEQTGDAGVRMTLQNDAGEAVTVFAFTASSTDQGFADLIAFDADMVMASREVRAGEVAKAADAGLGQLDDPKQSRMIGVDGLVAVTAQATGAIAISLDALARAYQGEVLNWSEIGGPDLPISLHLGPQTDGQTQGLLDRVVRLGGGKLVDTVVHHNSIPALETAVTETLGALGVMPYGDARFVQALPLRDACGFIASPVLTTLKTEDYPLTAPLFLYYPSRRLPEISRAFLAFLRTPQAQLVVRRAGFVDQGAIPIPMDAQGQRFLNAIAAAGEEVPLLELQRMVRVLAPRTRMSTSFRFEVGSTRLDAPSRSNLLNLGQAIHDGRYDGQNLLLVGFSDGRGAAGPNRELSSARAEAVKRALQDIMAAFPETVTVETAAFGEALPMGCDDTEWGRQTNRRVELWVTQGSE